MPSCAAWGDTSLISTVWDNKKLIENKLSSTLAVSLGWFGNAEFSSLVKTENSYIKIQ